MENLKDGDIVIAPNGFEENIYVTSGKEYIVSEVSIGDLMTDFNITNDLGSTSYCLLKDCAYIDNLNWIIKKNNPKK